jgi:malate dehydrogenase (oxaloacetate-decarboxylating)
MEGKSALYASFVGLSAIPMVMDVRDPDAFIETVMRVSPGFGAIHLEDIRVPDCFRIERELMARLNKPVMHDDQHGTAVAALSALVNACKLTGRDPKQCVMGQIGLGAAGSAIAKLVHRWGVQSTLVTDPNPVAVDEAVAWGAKRATLADIMRECDIVIATTGRPGLITPAMVRKGQILFALSNPDPEIQPDDAIAAGAAYAGDGRSVNNALAYPGIFKGALQVRSRAITPEMLLAAVGAIASVVEPGELVPSPLDPRVHAAVTEAVAAAATAAGLANTARTTGPRPT